MHRANRNIESLFNLVNADADSILLNQIPISTAVTTPGLEKKYQEGQDAFKTVFERSPFGTIILTKTLLVLNVNQALVGLLNCKVKDSVIGTSILEHAHPDYKQDWLALQSALWLEKKASINFETCLVNSFGVKIWCEVTCIFYHDNGYGLGYTIVEDITKRKQDEEAVKKSEANLRNILENADCGYVLYNHERRIVLYNNLAQKFSHELYGKDLVPEAYILDYFPQERHQILMDVTTQVINGGEMSYEILISNEFGEKWMEVKWLNVNNQENKNWGFILASKNITEKKLAAAEREKMTADLINRNKVLEQFTNITSHNLRAPLANIIGLLELVDELDLNETEKKDMMNSALISARNLDTVITDINQILTVRDKQSELKQDVFFDELVNSIKTSISNIIVKEHVTINCHFEQLNHLFTTRSYLYSVFYNLILNSIKYRKPDVPSEINITSTLAKTNVTLTFADNGKGIDLKRNGEKMFGLYRRFDSSVEGKGLGLFMIKAQIESIGGTINVESELGKGATFIIELPL